WASILNRTLVASWEADGGRERPAVLLPRCIDLTFSPDGRSVAGCGAGAAARVWDLDGGERLVLAGPRPQGGRAAPAAAPGAGLLAWFGTDGPLRLWGLADGAERRVVFRGPFWGHSLPFAVAADGSAVAVAFGNRDVQVVDPVGGRARVVLNLGIGMGPV